MPELLELETPERSAFTIPDVVPQESPAAREPLTDPLRREAFYRRLLIVADLFATMLATLLTATAGGAIRLTVQAFAIVLVTPVVAKVVGLYDRDEPRLNRSTLDEVPSLIQLATFVAFLSFVGSPWLFDHVFSPENGAVFVLTLFAALVVLRAGARRAAGLLTRPERCLFIGSRGEAMRFQEKLEHDPAANAKLVAQVELDAVWPWTASLEPDDAVIQARHLVRELEAQRVIIAPHNPLGSDVVTLMRMFEGAGVRVSVIPALLQVVGSSVEFDDVHGVAVLGVRSFRLSRSSRFAKRCFDLLAAMTLILLTAPVTAIIAIAIRLDSHGPILFRQERVGRAGRRFWVFKFRSMVADAEERKRGLAAKNDAAEGFFKIVGDPRITGVGRLLRKSSLDELPQLFNVLRGEMSLVGPRPLIPEEDARVVGWHRRRLELTPGITGHWQVLGSSRVPLGEMVAIDYLYVANWSLWSDMKLLLRTVPHVAGRRGV